MDPWGRPSVGPTRTWSLRGCAHTGPQGGSSEPGFEAGPWGVLPPLAWLSGSTWEQEEELGAGFNGQAPRSPVPDCMTLGQRLPIKSSGRQLTGRLPRGQSRFRGDPRTTFCRWQAGAGPWSAVVWAQRWVVCTAQTCGHGVLARALPEAAGPGWGALVLQTVLTTPSRDGPSRTSGLTRQEEPVHRPPEKRCAGRSQSQTCRRTGGLGGRGCRGPRPLRIRVRAPRGQEADGRSLSPSQWAQRRADWPSTLAWPTPALWAVWPQRLQSALVAPLPGGAGSHRAKKDQTQPAKEASGRS